MSQKEIRLLSLPVDEEFPAKYTLPPLVPIPIVAEPLMVHLVIVLFVASV